LLHTKQNTMIEPKHSDPHDPASGDFTGEEQQPASVISRRLHAFFSAQGWPRHKHSSQLAVILGLSRSGAFRKFQDGSFSSADLLALAQYFQVDVSTPLSSQPSQAPRESADAVAAQMQMGPRSLACMATLGTELGPHEHCELVATHDGSEWRVQPYAEAASTVPRHRVLHLSITPLQRPLPRIAILEDSADLAANLQEAFTRSGYHASTFASASDLSSEAAIAPFDAYIVDWWLGGQTAADALRAIRRAQPAAPMILTTGAIASGNAAEEEIARMALTLRIQVIEKPFRLALLISQVKQLLGESS